MCINFVKKIVWVTFWEGFAQTHLEALVEKQLDSVESLQNESVERIFLNECISDAGHGL
jgi:hypothetical protein